jgi:zinc-ribbon domain
VIDDPQQTAKLPTTTNGGGGTPSDAPLPGAPQPPLPPQGPNEAPPAPLGPDGAPSPPPTPATGIPAPPAAPKPAAGPPVGPPRFPLPGRRKDDLAAPKPKSAEEKAREAELKEEESAELIAQRDRLLEKFTVMQADLGGAFYEMAIRDHVRLDVLTRKAAELQRVDAELLAVERALELERSGAAGLCPSCGAPYGPAVHFCAQCGTPLMPSGAGA